MNVNSKDLYKTHLVPYTPESGFDVKTLFTIASKKYVCKLTIKEFKLVLMGDIEMIDTDGIVFRITATVINGESMRNSYMFRLHPGAVANGEVVFEYMIC